MQVPLFREELIRRALALGADDAGVCRAGDVLSGPSHRSGAFPEGIEAGHALLVLVLRHPPDQPELDFFVRREEARFGNSEGNRRLMEISRGLGDWLEGEGVPSRDLHYYVERGGVFMKDAAVLAGLGAVGVNNLFIHPRFGARVRLRVHLVGVPVAPSPPLEFHPCTACPRPCVDACPENVFVKGTYDAPGCQARLDHEWENARALKQDPSGVIVRQVRHCRACEFSCTYTGDGEG